MDTQTPLLQLYTESLGTVTDSLTGVYNHGIFEAFLGEECNRCDRYGDEFGLALIDVDYLGRLNAEKGPLAGDQALKSIAQIIIRCKRSVDIASRYSDDLFAVLYPKTSAKEAYNSAERMRTMVEQHFNASTTVSIGIAAYSGHALTKETLIAAAQKALKEAKLRGHNKTVLWDNADNLTSIYRGSG